jgi:hypothetical protein
LVAYNEATGCFCVYDSIFETYCQAQQSESVLEKMSGPF